ncbi:chromate transporter [Fusobacterium simiae]|uniref:Chromate transporter n=1 Tax=Fusobacterium simiae TaxID=855 RepID=A0ABT4DF21_FUSSI|nr:MULTISPECIES: chromate transporter [Fusobacterium]MCY7007198.1 chromate transporter [Fusobacterium simiae]MDC7955599.1 chromate transporter [Fusobacterium simiae]
MKKNRIIEIFILFFKIGAFTIGGGYAMLSLIEDEIVNKKKWLGHEEFLDGMAIAQSTPGVLAVNISLITGYKIAGFLGMFAGMLGAVLPSFFIVLFLSQVLLAYGNHPIVVAIFNGIKPAITALILISVYRIGKSANINRYNFILPVIVAVLIRFFGVSPILIIIATMILGNIYYAIKENKKNNTKEVDDK